MIVGFWGRVGFGLRLRVYVLHEFICIVGSCSEVFELSPYSYLLGILVSFVCVVCRLRRGRRREVHSSSGE